MVAQYLEDPRFLFIFVGMNKPIWVAALLLLVCSASAKDFRVADYGLNANSSTNASPILAKIIGEMKQYGKPCRLVFEKGRYDFHPEGATIREYYISNHDQDNPKTVGMAFEQLTGVTIEGNGADLMFHGRMLPLSIVQGKNITIKDLSIDFPKPHIAQVQVIANDSVAKTITFKAAPWVDLELRGDQLVNKGSDWENIIGGCIAFEEKTKRLVYRSSDVNYGKRKAERLDDRTVRAQWDNPMLIPGTVLAMRSWHRPAPAILLDHSTNSSFINTTIHYAEGMGLLAQMSTDITLKGFRVALRGANDPRYFTTQADATHFSGCRGKITSIDGFYEGMMDDAINVHGTYLKIVKRVSDRVVEAEYKHPQAYGFTWGYASDKVQFVAARTMELTGSENTVQSIQPIDKPTTHGAKRYRIEFAEPLAAEVDERCGIENLTWTPEVLFARNVVRNNRARGALFSTPRRTVVEDNLFDHTSGTAILLCGDCNGWYETGACKEVIIRKNRFVNALTSMFQFTNAVISIYPEIPELDKQQKYFHSGIVIEDNVFETFDQPLVYAKSVDGLVFRRNKVVVNTDYPAFHQNTERLKFERVVNAETDEL